MTQLWLNRRQPARRSHIRLGFKWWVVILLPLLVWLGFWGGVVYTAVHFIVKYW